MKRLLNQKLRSILTNQGRRNDLDSTLNRSSKRVCQYWQRLMEKRGISENELKEMDLKEITVEIQN